MFISRLTQKQIDEFFGKPTSFFINKKPLAGDVYLYVSFDTGSMMLNNRMYDFEGSTNGNEEAWRRYLYSIFGDEYYQAYAAYLDAQKADKLEALFPNEDDE